MVKRRNNACSGCNAIRMRNRRRFTTGAHPFFSNGFAFAMSNSRPQRALISVSDKSGLESFVRSLTELGFEILSTGGTRKFLEQAGIPVIDVTSYTGFPEIMDGRVKTLHPKVHGAILGRPTLASDAEAIDAHGIIPFQLVVVNLYPFQQTVAKPDVTFDEAI